MKVYHSITDEVNGLEIRITDDGVMVLDSRNYMFNIYLGGSEKDFNENIADIESFIRVMESLVDKMKVYKIYVE